MSYRKVPVYVSTGEYIDQEIGYAELHPNGITKFRNVDIDIYGEYYVVFGSQNNRDVAIGLSPVQGESTEKKLKEYF